MGKSAVINMEIGGREENLKNFYKSAGTLLARYEKINPNYIQKSGYFTNIILNLHSISGIKRKLIYLLEDHTDKISLEDREFKEHMVNILKFSDEGKKITRQEVATNDYYSVFMISFLTNH